MICVCLLVCMCTMCAVLLEARRGHQILHNWIYRFYFIVLFWFVLFSLHFQVGHNPSLREVRIGAETGAKEKCCLLASSQAHVQLPSSYSPRPPAQGWHHPQRDGPSHINQNQDNSSQTWPPISHIWAAARL